MSRQRPPLALGLTATWLALLGFLGGPLGEARPDPPELRAGLRLTVTSSRDSGPGSLREAILTADRSPERVRIDVLTPVVRLESSLPPLIGSGGTVLLGGPARPEIDGSGVVAGSLLDVAAPRSLVAGLRFSGAADQAVLVRAPGTALRDLELVDCDVGVLIAAGGDATRLEDSAFERNGVGISLEAAASAVVIQSNRFEGHDRAGVWAVGGERLAGVGALPVLLERNSFAEDRVSVVLIDVAGRLEGNAIARAGEVGLFLSGDVAARRNRIEAAGSIGIMVDRPAGAVLEQNEVSGADGIGLLVRDGGDVDLIDNRVYSNGYGIVVVFGSAGRSIRLTDNLVMSQQQDGVLVLGSSPSLARNSILQNGGAGIRLLDFVPLQGQRLRSDPELDGNVLDGNGSDQPARGEYHEPPPQDPR